MPQYSRFQYGIKQYGQYESSQTGKHKLSLLSGRIGIRSGNQIHYVYAHAPVSVPGNQATFRIRTNTGETLTQHTVRFNGDHDYIRMRTSSSQSYLVSQKGWN